MMANVGTQNPDLLTLPGPKGLFSTQFLIGSAIAIVMMPVTQPQLTTRLRVMKDLKSVHKMTYAVGLFAILVILPTAFIGLYGALKYPDVSTSEFLSSALLFDQANPFTGTSVMAPLVLAAVIFENPPKVLILTCGLALIGIILNILSVIPAQIAGLNFDIVLYMVHGGISVLIMATHKK